MRKLTYVLAAVIVILLVVGYFVAHNVPGTDEEQILAAIEAGRQGIEAKDLSKTMSAVSRNYKDEAGNNFDRLRIFGVQVFRTDATYTVNVIDPKVKVSGDEAEVQAEVRVNVGGGMGPLPPRAITLEMRKEPTRRFLIYKAPMWKVTAMVNASPLMDTGI